MWPTLGYLEPQARSSRTFSGKLCRKRKLRDHFLLHSTCREAPHKSPRYLGAERGKTKGLPHHDLRLCPGSQYFWYMYLEPLGKLRIHQIHSPSKNEPTKRFWVSQHVFNTSPLSPTPRLRDEDRLPCSPSSRTCLLQSTHTRVHRLL